MNAKEIIQNLVDEGYVDPVLTSEEYYYQKLADLYLQFQQYDVSAILPRLQNEVLPLLEDKSSYFDTDAFLAQFKDDKPLNDFLFLIVRMDTYVDDKAKNKHLWNEYPDKRILARPQTPMRVAIKFFIWLKIAPEKLPESHIFVNCLRYIKEPDRYTTIMSDKQKVKIARLLWQDDSTIENFFDQLLQWFRKHILYQVSNPLNEPVFWSIIMYSEPIKALWDTDDKLPDAAINNRKNQSSNSVVPTNHPQLPLNTILYGPPGTGKTYSTIDLAVKVVAPGNYVENSHEENKTVFDTLVKNGFVVFTTFHQSMSYEDFIEGIKPESLEGGQISYTVKDGIFKKLCNMALTPNQQDFEAAYEKLKQELSTKEKETLGLQTPTGKFFSISLNSNGNLSLHTGPNKEKQGTLTKENIQKQINGEEKFVGWEGYFKGVVNYLKDNYNYSEEAKDDEQRYVIIIDEINRGNVSQIFGELITLIEEDKRLGNKEALEITLPYSQHKFGVPSNVYIIGTMNTADRSVEALDTALRRRFSFKEMAPNNELLSFKNMVCTFWNKPEHIFTTRKQWLKEPYLTKADTFYKFIGFSREKEAEVLDQDAVIDRDYWLPEDMDILNNNDFTGVNLKTLLRAINIRLEKLLTKDHQIGHAFFINVFSEADLYNAFYQKLIPQLQEYFYGDFGKIGLVLGSAFVKLKEEKSKVGFATFPYDDVQMLQEKKVYLIHDFNADGQTDLDDFIAAVKQVYQ